MATRDIQQFETLFKEYFKPLTGFAMKYVGDLDDAKNTVHEVFISFWEKFESLPQDTNYKSYLYTAVRNRCLNLIRDRKKVISLDQTTEDIRTEDHSELETNELEREIEFAINSLPAKCRKVFEMSRYEEMKYAEIAEKLDISVKTVEGRMTKALSLLRDSLGGFITVAFLTMNFQGLVSLFVF